MRPHEPKSFEMAPYHLSLRPGSRASASSISPEPARHWFVDLFDFDDGDKRDDDPLIRTYYSGADYWWARLTFEQAKILVASNAAAIAIGIKPEPINATMLDSLVRQNFDDLMSKHFRSRDTSEVTM